MSLGEWGAICFGLVVGWITYRTLRRRKGTAAISDIAAVIGAVGGGAVTAQFDSTNLFASYCIGLAVGFFAYLLVGSIMNGKKEVGDGGVDDWMGTP